MHRVRLSLRDLALAGATIGYLNGIVTSTKPTSVPVVIGYGLTQGAFIGTEAAGSLAGYATKTLIFQGFGAPPPEIGLKGLAVGASLMVWALIAKPFGSASRPTSVSTVMDGLMLIADGSMLWNALDCLSVCERT